MSSRSSSMDRIPTVRRHIVSGRLASSAWTEKDDASCVGLHRCAMAVNSGVEDISIKHIVQLHDRYETVKSMRYEVHS